MEEKLTKEELQALYEMVEVDMPYAWSRSKLLLALEELKSLREKVDGGD